jgi:hypothetical protein
MTDQLRRDLAETLAEYYYPDRVAAIESALRDAEARGAEGLAAARAEADRWFVAFNEMVKHRDALQLALKEALK